MPVMPESAWRAIQQAKALAAMIGVPAAMRVADNGLYVGTRHRRDPINTNRWRIYMTVRLRRDGVEIFREDVSTTGFPSAHLVAQLMLIA